jgi:hypothetical protein
MNYRISGFFLYIKTIFYMAFIPDSHQSEKSDPDPLTREKPDPDPHLRDADPRNAFNILPI